MKVATNDPDELLEVFDKNGHGTGRAKTRAEIHRQGLWHLAFFCWIVTSAGEVVLQRRAATKDVWPGRFDASAAGHVRFGGWAAVGGDHHGGTRPQRQLRNRRRIPPTG